MSQNHENFDFLKNRFLASKSTRETCPRVLGAQNTFLSIKIHTFENFELNFALKSQQCDYCTFALKGHVTKKREIGVISKPKSFLKSNADTPISPGRFKGVNIRSL